MVYFVSIPEYNGMFMFEGVVEQDPMTDKHVLHVVEGGRYFTFDPEAELSKLKGKEVRVIVADLEEIQRLAGALEGGQPMFVGPEVLGKPSRN